MDSQIDIHAADIAKARAACTKAEKDFRDANIAAFRAIGPQAENMANMRAKAAQEELWVANDHFSALLHHREYRSQGPDALKALFPI